MRKHVNSLVLQDYSDVGIRMINVKVKYQIKVKGQSLMTVGPATMQVQAKSESAVMAAIRKHVYADTRPVESIVILSIQ